MKKLTYLISLFLSLFSLNDLNAYIVSTPPHIKNFVPEIQKNYILSTSEENIEFIYDHALSFNVNEYQIHLIPNVGMFFLDNIIVNDWIKNVLRQGSVWEPGIEDLIKKYAKSGTTVLDVGAHIGTHTFSMSKAVGSHGQVIAFEPQPKSYRELLMNTMLNQTTNIYSFWAALGDEMGEINLPNFIPQCEIVQLNNYSYGASGIKAPLITLDSLNLNNISLMKVDVDGWEDQFLAGASETILRNRPVIIIEIGGFYDVDYKLSAKERNNQVAATKQKIIQLGYEIFQVSPIDYLALPK